MLGVKNKKKNNAMGTTGTPNLQASIEIKDKVKSYQTSSVLCTFTNKS